MLTENYKTLTTFGMDFSIADRFGTAAIKDTYKRGLEYAKTDYRYFTEFVVVLNHKIWQHWEKNNQPYAKLYDTLWRNSEDEFFKKFGKNKQAVNYYYQITD